MLKTSLPHHTFANPFNSRSRGGGIIDVIIKEAINHNGINTKTCNFYPVEYQPLPVQLPPQEDTAPPTPTLLLPDPPSLPGSDSWDLPPPL